jgi:HSP20 family protein
MTSLATTGYRDPFSILRQMTAELDRAFTEPFWPARHWPAFDSPQHGETTGWSPRVDVFEKEGCMVTRVDLPGVKKDDVTVEVTDGHLALSGERRQEKDEQKDNVYRTEREYGSFYRAIPLPDGVKTEDVKGHLCGWRAGGQHPAAGKARVEDPEDPNRRRQRRKRVDAGLMGAWT